MYYDILKASKVKAEVFPDYWTLLWGRKMSASMIKTITGVLPLTFTAKGGNAVDWVIEGNDDAGENLINVADFTVGVAETHNIFSGILPAGTYTAAVYQNTALTSAERNTLAMLKTSGAIYESANTNYHLAAGWHYLTFTIAESEDVDLRYWTVNASSSVNCTSVMLVKGSTAPDHYIPYQQGVGERTVNELKLSAYSQTISNVVITVDRDAGTVKAKGLSSGLIAFKLGSVTLGAGSYRLQGCASGGSYNSYRLDLRTTPYTVYDNVVDNGEGATFTLASEMTLDVYLRCAGSVDYDVTFYPLVKSGSGAINFIPYGYQIPLAVSQQGQPDKTVDIYIGDSPLTEGETVSKTSTGVDIELFEGENTVSTTLYNKPEMEIRYK